MEHNQAFRPLPNWFIACILIMALFLLSACDPMCMAEVEISAWNDANGNGLQEAEESSLENIAIDYAKTYGSFKRQERQGFVGTLTNGKATLLQPTLGSCPSYLSGKARQAQGYTSSTADDFGLVISTDTKATISLGFTYETAVTPTPRPTGATECYSIAGFGYGNITGVEFMPNGDVWVARSDSVRPLALLREGQEFYQDLGTFGGVNDIAQAPDQTLWAAGDYAIGRYDGKSWIFFKTENGLPIHHARGIEVTPDGHVWALGPAVEFGSESKLAEYDPASGVWHDRADLGDGYWLLQGKNGEIWAVNSFPFSVMHFNHSDPYNTIRRSKPADMAQDSYAVHGVALTLGGILWAGAGLENGEPILIRYDPDVNKWSTLSYTSTLGSMPMDNIYNIVSLQDESIFVETSLQGGYRYIPNNSGDPRAGAWISFPDLADKTDQLIPIDLPSSLDEFIWLKGARWSGYHGLCMLQYNHP